MPKQSAGILVFRQTPELQFFLVHPGGAFWAKKDLGAWSIPKGEFTEEENPLNAAQREFREETGFTASEPFIPLQTVRQSSGKTVHAWACAGDFDPSKIVSNVFSIEWPPKSGQKREFPEVDRAGWFNFEEATKKILPAQIPFLERLRISLKNP